MHNQNSAEPSNSGDNRQVLGHRTITQLVIFDTIQDKQMNQQQQVVEFEKWQALLINLTPAQRDELFQSAQSTISNSNTTSSTSMISNALQQRNPLLRSATIPQAAYTNVPMQTSYQQVIRPTPSAQTSTQIRPSIQQNQQPFNAVKQAPTQNSQNQQQQSSGNQERSYINTCTQQTTSHVSLDNLDLNQFRMQLQKFVDPLDSIQSPRLTDNKFKLLYMAKLGRILDSQRNMLQILSHRSHNNEFFLTVSIHFQNGMSHQVEGTMEEVYKMWPNDKDFERQLHKYAQYLSPPEIQSIEKAFAPLKKTYNSQEAEFFRNSCKSILQKYNNLDMKQKYKSKQSKKKTQETNKQQSFQVKKPKRIGQFTDLELELISNQISYASVAVSQKALHAGLEDYSSPLYSAAEKVFCRLPGTNYDDGKAYSVVNFRKYLRDSYLDIKYSFSKNELPNPIYQLSHMMNEVCSFQLLVDMRFALMYFSNGYGVPMRDMANKAKNPRAQDWALKKLDAAIFDNNWNFYSFKELFVMTSKEVSPIGTNNLNYVNNIESVLKRKYDEKYVKDIGVYVLQFFFKLTESQQGMYLAVLKVKDCNEQKEKITYEVYCPDNDGSFELSDYKSFVNAKLPGKKVNHPVTHINCKLSPDKLLSCYVYCLEKIEDAMVKHPRIMTAKLLMDLFAFEKASKSNLLAILNQDYLSKYSEVVQGILKESKQLQKEINNAKLLPQKRYQIALQHTHAKRPKFQMSLQYQNEGILSILIFIATYGQMSPEDNMMNTLVEQEEQTMEGLSNKEKEFVVEVGILFNKYMKYCGIQDKFSVPSLETKDSMINTYKLVLDIVEEELMTQHSQILQANEKLKALDQQQLQTEVQQVHINKVKADLACKKKELFNTLIFHAYLEAQIHLLKQITIEKINASKKLSMSPIYQIITLVAQKEQSPEIKELLRKALDLITTAGMLEGAQVKTEQQAKDDQMKESVIVDITDQEINECEQLVKSITKVQVKVNVADFQYSLFERNPEFEKEFSVNVHDLYSGQSGVRNFIKALFKLLKEHASYVHLDEQSDSLDLRINLDSRQSQQSNMNQHQPVAEPASISIGPNAGGLQGPQMTNQQSFVNSLQADPNQANIVSGQSNVPNHGQQLPLASNVLNEEEKQPLPQSVDEQQPLQQNVPNDQQPLQQNVQIDQQPLQQNVPSGQQQEQPGQQILNDDQQQQHLNANDSNQIQGQERQDQQNMLVNVQPEEQSQEFLLYQQQYLAQVEQQPIPAQQQHLDSAVNQEIPDGINAPDDEQIVHSDEENQNLEEAKRGQNQEGLHNYYLVHNNIGYKVYWNLEKTVAENQTGVFYSENGQQLYPAQGEPGSQYILARAKRASRNSESDDDNDYECIIIPDRFKSEIASREKTLLEEFTEEDWNEGENRKIIKEIFKKWIVKDSEPDTVSSKSDDERHQQRRRSNKRDGNGEEEEDEEEEGEIVDDKRVSQLNKKKKKVRQLSNPKKQDKTVKVTVNKGKNKQKQSSLDQMLVQ